MGREWAGAGGFLFHLKKRAGRRKGKSRCGLWPCLLSPSSSQDQEALPLRMQRSQGGGTPKPRPAEAASAPSEGCGAQTGRRFAEERARGRCAAARCRQEPAAFSEQRHPVGSGTGMERLPSLGFLQSWAWLPPAAERVRHPARITRGESSR